MHCEDEDACTSDLCDSFGGTCVHEQVSCDDADGCTLDECDSAVGCMHRPIDFTGDGLVNASDLAILLGFWGVASPPFGDLNGDSNINPFDLAILLGNWGSC